MPKQETVLSVLKQIRDRLPVQTMVRAEVNSSSDRFVKNTDGTVLDKSTGLMWGKSFPQQMSWDDAIKACKELALGGHKDWRLPTVKELISIVDYGKHNPAIDAEFFPYTNASYHWSDTTHAGVSGYAWVVVFYGGGVFYFDKSDGYYVRPVRSGQ